MNKEPMLWLKFSGELLDVRSIPIYELGDTLVALQRIIHKTFLHDQARLKKHAQLTQEERKRLSLQISERKKSSDLYALVPFVTDTAVQQNIAMLLKYGLGALAKYALKNVFSSSKEPFQRASVKTENVEGSLLVGAIYAETVQITNHINNIGGVEKIELIPDRNVGIAPIKLTLETQGYVREIVNESYKGPKTEITGYVTRLHPNRLLADIKLEPGRYVKVGLDEESFRFVRYETEQEEQLKFRGHPIIRLGKDVTSYEEFEAETVKRKKGT
jgi:hypothetical protein